MSAGRIALAVVIVGSVGLLAATVGRKKKATPAVDAEPTNDTEAVPGADGTGIELRHGQIVVTDPTRAFEWIAIAADPAMREGADAEDVLASVFAQRFPEITWPPPVPGVQWVYMVKRVEALLRFPPPPGPARLRVVQ